MRLFLILTVLWIDAAYSVFHSLTFHRTSSCGDPNVPEYVEVGLVDKVPFIRFSCNSSRVEPKQAWMERFTADYPGYLKEESRRSRNDQETSRRLMRSVQERLNQTGVHMVQVTYGCEWDDKTGEIRGHYHYAYDGEDFLSLDLKTWTWIARTPRADSYKQEWVNDRGFNKYLQNYLAQRCPELLKKLLLYGNSSLLRTELPRVSLLQKTPSSPIVCHATGFYPAGAVLFWTKDEEELDENVEVGEVLPNPDGTFQMRAQLDLSDPSEDWGRYTCVFQLDISRKIKITPLTKEAILTNRKTEDQRTAIIVGSVAAVVLLLLLLTVVAAVCLRKLRKGHSPGAARFISEKNMDSRDKGEVLLKERQRKDSGCASYILVEVINSPGEDSDSLMGPQRQDSGRASYSSVEVFNSPGEDSDSLMGPLGQDSGRDSASTSIAGKEEMDSYC